MTQDKLREFFRQKNKSVRPANINWAAKRDAFISAVEELYKTIETNYLKRVRSEIKITRSEKIVAENHIGEYRISELHLSVGVEEVVFSPKGIQVAGAKGRIDVTGDLGDAMIVWQGEDRWSVVITRIPALRLVPLTSDSLADLLASVMRP